MLLSWVPVHIKFLCVPFEKAQGQGVGSGNMKPDIRFQGWKEEGDSWDRGVKKGRQTTARSEKSAAGY